MSNHRLVKPIEILLVVDNPGDADLAREALEGSKFHNILNVVDDGEKAMAYLHRDGLYAKVLRPDLILLDLNIPKKDGRQILAEIKSDDDLRRIPVVILTTSRAEEDVIKSYNLHCNCYIFLNVVRAIEDFWLSIVVLPPHGAKK